ncbi:MAG: EAL domain-containing protein [Clostridia bacterium]|nr:EAL domain-containing protein [Clostridia bacterium]
MEKYRYPEQIQYALEHLRQPFAVYQLIDKRVVTLVLSDGFCELFGYGEDRARAYYDMDHDMYKDAHPDDAARIADAALKFAMEGGTYEVIYRTRVKDTADYRVVHAFGEHVMTDTNVRLAHVWYTDEGLYGRRGAELNQVLSNALNEESLVRASRYDYLTGLPSMSYFFELATAVGESEDRALLYMDFSGMKFYNTRHGFSEGDKLLQGFAKVLSGLFSNENCCHIGADHFAVLTVEEGLEDRVNRLFEACRELNGGKSLPVHVGVYLSRMEDLHISNALDRAKIACDALRGAYASGMNYYDEKLKDSALRRQYILENLDRAIENGWIQVYYQAIVRAANAKVCDEEALSRWIDPVRGFLSPAEFIPALEEARLIYKLDLYVVEQVLEKIKRQAEAGMYVVPQSVNLSRMDFDSCDIVEEIRRRVDAAGVDRSMLTIEVTESVVGSDFDFMKEQVRRFRDLGFAVWMDDFGSGYSSLDVLQQIHFDLIKLDMRFMERFDSGDEGRIILTELVRMAMGLGVETVCEGVEQEAQVEFLREIGCTKIQGYYYCKPMSFDAMLQMHRSGADMCFENPEESEYYAALGRVNLYDMAAITGDADDTLRRYFDTLPMAILEVNGGKARYARCNKSYRDFMKRLFGVDPMDLEMDSTGLPGGRGAAFISAVLRCSQDGNRAVVDEPVDEKTTVHSFIRRVAVNAVTGSVAVAAAVLSVMEETGNAGASIGDVTRALSSDYINLYYVDLDTEQFIEYTTDASLENLVVERHGADFFSASAKDAQLFIYRDDREYFTEAFTKQNVTRMMDEHGTFTLTYRLLINDEPTYVSMKAVRMRTDGTHIIVGVSNVDAQMRQKEAMARLQAEQKTYSRINALATGYICMYTVDPETGSFYEYSVTSDYALLDIAKAGEDFWAQSRIESAKHVFPEDVEKFQTLFTRDRVMEEIEQRGVYSLKYRMVLEGEPTYVEVRAALVLEQDRPQLIIGVNNIDAQVRREQDYERKLAAARSRANLDTLTGVKNRTAYDNMSQTLTRQIEGGQSVQYAIALCRVLGLERVNESEGREAGNRLIREACAVICNVFKHSPVFRVAGDQFAAIAQGHDYEAIDALVAQMDALNRANAQGGGPVIACGMARYDGTGSVAAVFEKADERCRARG